MTEYQDAFGALLADELNGKSGAHVIERDDGFIAPPGLGTDYIAPPTGTHLEALRLVKGRVLDIGAGAGRVALFLQEHGCEVVAIDISPGAVQVMQRRGVADARLMQLRDVHRRNVGVFDAFVMMGNNFGLFGERNRARRLLRRFARMSSADALIIAETLDPYQTSEPFHLAYHEQNRGRGRMAGQVRLRVRYRAFKTPWFDYLFVSREELAGLLVGTGWKIRETIDSPGATYIAVIEKHR